MGNFRTFEVIPKCVAQTYTVSKKGNKYYVAFAINAELIAGRGTIPASRPPIQHEVIEPVGLDINLSDGKYCVLSVDTFYPSSKLCSQCGKKKKNLTLSDRIYRCDSPFCQLIDRDLNSAINLKNASSKVIINRVGSTRIDARGHRSADTYGLKREKNVKARQFLLPLSK